MHNPGDPTPRAFHWDGTPVDTPDRRQRRIRIHRTSGTRTLRRDARQPCRYCGNLVDWFDRYDNGRIPLTPMDLPLAAVPPRYQWSVTNGRAYPGAGPTEYCRIAHPAICPAIEHENTHPVIADAIHTLRLRTQGLIKAGTFVPSPVPPEDEEQIGEEVPAVVGSERHILSYLSTLRLAPQRLDQIRCVAHAAKTQERCRNVVLHQEFEEGEWQQVDIPYAQGRLGQAMLGPGSEMWVYALTVVTMQDALRWLRQRCNSHWPDNSAHDAVPPEWVTFRPLSHQEFIHYTCPNWTVKEHKSEAAPLLAFGGSQPTLTICAGEGCTNGSMATVEDKWLCYRCRPRYQRRGETHRKWQPQDDPGLDANPVPGPLWLDLPEPAREGNDDPGGRSADPMRVPRDGA